MKSDITVLKNHFNGLSMNHIRIMIGQILEKEMPVVVVALKELYEMSGI